VEKARQRDLCALACALCILAVLAACTNVAIPEPAATAIAAAPTLAAGAQTSAYAAQTAVVGAQTAVSVAQTVLPGAQATVQAGATVAAGVLANPQLLSQALALLLAGANVTLQTVPPDASGDAVQQVTVKAVDTSGAFGRLDAGTQRQAANGALLAAARAFPTATITLEVQDSAGTQLLTGTKTPGNDASVSQ
jgi:hypothetical protein